MTEQPAPDSVEAQHLRVMAGVVRDVWRMARRWARDDETEALASDLFTAMSPLVGWETEHGVEHTVPDAGTASAEVWTWSLMVSKGGNAVELLRNGVHRLTVPLDELQTEVLMGKPLTLASVIADDPVLGPRVETGPDERPGHAP